MLDVASEDLPFPIFLSNHLFSCPSCLFAGGLPTSGCHSSNLCYLLPLRRVKMAWKEMVSDFTLS